MGGYFWKQLIICEKKQLHLEIGGVYKAEYSYWMFCDERKDERTMHILTNMLNYSTTNLSHELHFHDCLCCSYKMSLFKMVLCEDETIFYLGTITHCD